MSSSNHVIEHFQHYLTSLGKSSNTVKAYTHDVASFVQWWEHGATGDFKPDAVDSFDILDYRGHLLKKKRTSSTINRRLNALRKFFRWVKQQEPAFDNPFDILESVFVKEQKDTAPGWLDRKQQLTLLRVVRDSGNKRDLAITQTLLGTGLRISELVALELSDLEISERKGALYVRSGKGMKQRVVPLVKKTRVALAAYVEERPPNESEKVFMGQRGPLTPRGVNQLIAKYAYMARLEGCTAHSLRHSFAKNLVDTGTPLDQVATLLGHENLNTTRIYTKPSQQDLMRALKRAAGEE